MDDTRSGPNLSTQFHRDIEADERAAMRQRQRNDEVMYRAAFFGGTTAGDSARDSQLRKQLADLQRDLVRQAAEIRQLKAELREHRAETEELVNFMANQSHREGC